MTMAAVVMGSDDDGGGSDHFDSEQCIHRVFSRPKIPFFVMVIAVIVVLMMVAVVC